jgi:hypothetical protein
MVSNLIRKQTHHVLPGEIFVGATSAGWRLMIQLTGNQALIDGMKERKTSLEMSQHRNFNMGAV